MDNLCSKSSNVLLTEVNAFYFYVKSLQNKNILSSKLFFKFSIHFKKFVSLAITRMTVYEKFSSNQSFTPIHFRIHIVFTKYFILAGPFLDDLHIGKGFGLNPSFQIVQHFACIWIKRKSVSSLQNSTLLHNSSYDSSI